jgi:hypothetical protein
MGATEPHGTEALPLSLSLSLLVSSILSGHPESPLAWSIPLLVRAFFGVSFFLGDPWHPRMNRGEWTTYLGLTMQATLSGSLIRPGWHMVI